MRFFTDDPTEVPVVWFFCSDRARLLPTYTVFGSGNWASNRLDWPGLGEVLDAPRPWYNGARPPGLDGRRFCGTVGQFRAGVPVPSDIPVSQTGIPRCCVTGQGVALGGQSNFQVVAVPLCFQVAFDLTASNAACTQCNRLNFSGQLPNYIDLKQTGRTRWGGFFRHMCGRTVSLSAKQVAETPPTFRLTVADALTREDLVYWEGAEVSINVSFFVFFAGPIPGWNACIWNNGIQVSRKTPEHCTCNYLPDGVSYPYNLLVSTNGIGLGGESTFTAPTVPAFEELGGASGVNQFGISTPAVTVDAGDLVVVNVAAWDSVANPLTVTGVTFDGNAMTSSWQQSELAGTGSMVAGEWRYLVPANVTALATATLNASAIDLLIVISRITNLGAHLIDQVSYASSSVDGDPNSGSITTVAADVMVHGCVALWKVPFPGDGTWNNGFTWQGGGGTGTILLSHAILLVSGATTTDASETGTSNDSWVCGVVSYY